MAGKRDHMLTAIFAVVSVLIIGMLVVRSRKQQKRIRHQQSVIAALGCCNQQIIRGALQCLGSLEVSK